MGTNFDAKRFFCKFCNLNKAIVPPHNRKDQNFHQWRWPCIEEDIKNEIFYGALYYQIVERSIKKTDDP